MLQAKLWKGKKGFYAIFVVLLFVVLLSYAFVHLATKFQDFQEERVLGERQFALLWGYQKFSNLSLFLDIAGSLAVQQSIHALAMQGGIGKECQYQGFGKWDDNKNSPLTGEFLGSKMVGLKSGVVYPTIFDKNCQFSLPKLHALLSEKVNQEMQQYLSSLAIVEGKKIPYEITWQENREDEKTAIAGIAPEHLSLQISCNQGESGELCGELFFQPSFTAHLGYSFADYGILQKKILGDDGFVTKIQDCERGGDDFQMCINQALHALQDGAFLFSQDCFPHSAEKAFYSFVEKFTSCQGAVENDCRCNLFDFDALEQIRNGLGEAYEISLDFHKQEIALKERSTNSILLQEAMPRTALCYLTNSYRDVRSFNDDTERAVFFLRIYAAEGSFSSSTLVFAPNEQETGIPLEQREFPIYRHRPFLCFVPTGDLTHYQEAPLCTLPESRIAKFCAVTKQNLLSADPLQGVVEKPVTYRIAVEIPK
ncbi:hypothetical protein HYS48_05355 [Candidatus Woesearchaeota archaeon]|nr:hypothetical protein [Candidatus Woesearchaeota archaeon]